MVRLAADVPDSEDDSREPDGAVPDAVGETAAEDEDAILAAAFGPDGAASPPAAAPTPADADGAAAGLAAPAPGTTPGWSGVIEGRLDVYWAGNDDWVVGAIRPAGGGGPVQAAGIVVAEADLKRNAAFAGVVEIDPKRKRPRFRIRGVVDTAIDRDGLLAYLSSGLVKHVGVATASAILAAFGDSTLDVLLRDPARLGEVRGIGESRVPDIRESLAGTLPLAAAVGLLAPLGARLDVARSAVRKYGSAAAAAIREDPWLLCLELPGVGFATADRVGLGLGFAKDHPTRLEAAVLHAIGVAVLAGHTVAPEDRVVAASAALLGMGPRAPWPTAGEEYDRTGMADEDDLDNPGGDDVQDAPAAPPPQADAATAALALALDRLVSAGRLVRIGGTGLVSRADVAEAESRVAETVGMLLSTRRPPVGVADAEISAIEGRNGIRFDQTQRDALAGALDRGVTIVTGGPGTGKTTIMRSVCDLAETRGLSVSLMSFTGKAAKVLSEATGRTATTIHRYLGFKPRVGFTGPEEASDVLVVDEVSMLDVILAGEICNWVVPDTRLILVGDVDQLPAIGPGNVLGDLADSGRVPVFRLDTIHRTDSSSAIPGLARAVNLGLADEVDAHMDGRTTRFVACPDAPAVERWVRAHFSKYRDRADEFQVLVPMKAGTAGADNLNRVVSETVNGPASGRGRVIGRERAIGPSTFIARGDRVIWTRNDRELGLLNGEIGTVREVRPNGFAVVEFTDGRFDIPPEKCERLMLAYALTVHRAQGSQFPIVVVVMDGTLAHGKAEALYARRLLYTAITRASGTVAVVGQRRTLSEAIARHGDARRRTALPLYLSERVAS